MIMTLVKLGTTGLIADILMVIIYFRCEYVGVSRSKLAIFEFVGGIIAILSALCYIVALVAWVWSW